MFFFLILKEIKLNFFFFYSSFRNEEEIPLCVTKVKVLTLAFNFPTFLFYFKYSFFCSISRTRLVISSMVFNEYFYNWIYLIIVSFISFLRKLNIPEIILHSVTRSLSSLFLVKPISSIICIYKIFEFTFLSSTQILNTRNLPFHFISHNNKQSHQNSFFVTFYSFSLLE